MMPAYLLTSEAGVALRRPVRTVYRMVERLELPALHLGQELRIEAWALYPGAPYPQYDAPTWSTRDLCELWRISPKLVTRLVREGLGARLVPQPRGSGWVYAFARRDVQRWVNDHSSGPDLDGPALPISDERWAHAG